MTRKQGIRIKISSGTKHIRQNHVNNIYVNEQQNLGDANIYAR